MGGLFGGGGSTISTSEQALGALRIQTSAYGYSVPIVHGKTRITANMIWYGDFAAIPHTTTQSSGGGGKGGGGVTSSNTTYTYQTGTALGLCEGPIYSIGTVWASKDQTSLAALGLTLFSGSYSQSAWGYLTTNHPTQALGYQGTAYVANGAYQLGSSDSLPNHSFEVDSGMGFSGGIRDVNPPVSFTAFLISANYGACPLGFPLGDLTQWSNYCIANGIFISAAIVEQRPASEYIRDYAEITNSALVHSEGVLKVIPYGDTAITGNGVTYTPNITPIYDITDDDFLDLPVVRRKTPADAFNQVQVEFLNRANQYNPEPAEAKDQANIEQYGLLPAPVQKAHWICESAIAQKVAQLKLQRLLYIRNEYDIKLGWKYCLLEPMDIVTITDPFGLLFFQIRVIAVEEDESGELSITFEEFPFGVAHQAQYPTQTPGGYSVDYNVAPGNAHTPVVFEPPLSLSTQPEIWIGTSGGVDWGGAEVWVSTDNASYVQVGSIAGGARHGALSALLPVGADPDTANTCSVDLTVSRGALLNADITSRDAYYTLFYAGGELLSYATAVLTGLNTYNLTSLRRGAYGTPIASHAIGSPFLRLDAAVFKYPYDPALIGKTLYIKLRSFNIYGGAHQDLATVTPSTYAIAGAPLGGVSGLALTQPFTGTSCKIGWNAYAGAIKYTVEVWNGGVLRRSSSSVDPHFEYTFEDSKADGGPWRALEFRVKAVSLTGTSSASTNLSITNAQVAAPTVSTRALQGAVQVASAFPSDVDYAGTIIWVSPTTGFNPLTTAPNYDGPDVGFTAVGLVSGNTYYVRVAHYDVFGADSLNISTEVAVTTLAVGGIDVVGTLPSTGLSDGRVVYLSTDQKLYRYNLAGTAWVTWTDGADILASSIVAGKLSVTDLSAISANLGSIVVDNAHIGALAVSTLSIQGNAVTLPISAYTNMPMNVPTTYAIAISVGGVNVTDALQPVDINFSSALQVGCLAGLGGDVYYKLVRNTTQLNTVVNAVSVPAQAANFAWQQAFSMSFQDLPGIGGHAYFLYLSINTNGMFCNARELFMEAMVVKK